MVTIEKVWARIVAHEGEEFHMKREGETFTYKIKGNGFFPSRTNYDQISESDFEKALELVPFDGPGVVNRLVRGPSYVWAVLHDPRIRLQDY